MQVLFLGCEEEAKAYVLDLEQAAQDSFECGTPPISKLS